jgi:hypothetical protein
LRSIPALVFLSENLLAIRVMCIGVGGVAGHREKGTDDTSDNNIS